MMLSNQIEIVRKNFYRNDVNFKEFKDINDEELKRIKALVDRTSATLFSVLPDSYYINKNLGKYLAVMRFLCAVNKELPTYDAKIIFLIEALDPNLELYKAYLELPIVLKSQLAMEENTKKKLILQQTYNNQRGQIESAIRLKIGFYDSKLLVYEIKYFKLIRCHSELLTKVNHAYFAKFALNFKNSNKFKDITSADNEALILKAEDYLSKYDISINTLSYQMLYQQDILGLNSIDEVIIFFILTIDKNFRLLDIYHEESTWDEIEVRSLEEFGFFNKDLFLLEKAYQEKFVPSYIPWDKKKEVIEYN